MTSSELSVVSIAVTFSFMLYPTPSPVSILDGWPLNFSSKFTCRPHKIWSGSRHVFCLRFCLFCLNYNEIGLVIIVTNYKSLCTISYKKPNVFLSPSLSDFWRVTIVTCYSYFFAKVRVFKGQIMGTWLKGNVSLDKGMIWTTSYKQLLEIR
jgi:hypothetical protein